MKFTIDSLIGGPVSWTEPAHAYFRRDATGWTLVGFERVPGGNPPAPVPREPTVTQTAAPQPSAGSGLTKSGT